MDAGQGGADPGEGWGRSRGWMRWIQGRVVWIEGRAGGSRGGWAESGEDGGGFRGGAGVWSRGSAGLQISGPNVMAAAQNVFIPRSNLHLFVQVEVRFGSSLELSL